MSPVLSCLVGVLLTAGARAGEAPHVRELRTQRVGDSLYFHVRFERPADLDTDPHTGQGTDASAVAAALAVMEINPATRAAVRQPRLVPQDDAAWAVYRRFDMAVTSANAKSDKAPPTKPSGAARKPASVPSAEGLEFLGKATREGQAKFVLLYPVRAEEPAGDADQAARPAAAALAGGRPAPWAEVPITLDLARARKVPAPAAQSKRARDQSISPDDLERLWAVGQAEQFAVLEALAPADFGFYTFAREATGRKYHVPTSDFPRPAGPPAAPPNAAVFHAQLYETTTGAAAITESLQRLRLIQTGRSDTGPRRVPIASVTGIDIAEHPWKKMIGDRKPAIEPLARYVPRDNYYVHFKSARALLDLGDLIDEWGATLIQAYELHSRDVGLRARYEKQLCLRSTPLGRLLGPAVIDSLAITGNDLYLREGSDLTVLFRVRNRELFLQAVEPFLREARREFAGQLAEAKETYHGTTIESFVTPLREVSLYRATLDDVVIYSNSPAGVRRALDARLGRLPCLADSLDFHYMRTVYPLDDPREDGLIFFSDPFLRQFVGPAGKIKEKRRLEALTSLVMMTNGALFNAWETAAPHADPDRPLQPTGLKPQEVYAPGGRDVAWDARRRVALSDVYNTLRFATPLVELSINRVTDAEAQGYAEFCKEYVELWRRYFDPIGVRFALRPTQVRAEVHILPLVRNTSYQELRDLIGGGTVKMDPAALSPQTVFQLKTHLNPRQEERQELTTLLSIMDGKISFDFLGDWFLLRLEDSPVYAKLAALAERMDEDPNYDPREGLDLLFQVPLTVGVDVRQPLVLAGALGAVRGTVLAAYPGGITWAPMEPAYKGVSIVRIQANDELVQELADDLSDLGGGPGKKPATKKKVFNPAIYYAVVGRAFYLSLTEDALKSIIDAAVARRDGKKPAVKGEVTRVNSSLYVGAGTGHALRAAGALLESAIREQALANGPVLDLLYRTALVRPDASRETVRSAALRYFGFVPVSPDSAPYRYDARLGDVVNARYGSMRRPVQARPEESRLPAVLAMLRSLRADLRFEHDGLRSVVTLERKAAK
jgi:hypothetical protein